MPDATLHLMCGKIAAGKSTLSAKLSAQQGTITIAEDHWLKRLYPGEINTIADYVRLAARLRETIAPHVEDLLRTGLSIVLDFPANTVANRAWMRGIIDRSGARHVLHHRMSPTRSVARACGPATRLASMTSRPPTPSSTP